MRTIGQCRNAGGDEYSAEKCVMKILCPYCSQETEIPESARVQHNVSCARCGKRFFAAGELAFCYGKRLDLFRASKEKKIACPYCGQHYTLDFQPLNNMLGCSECLRVFVLPPTDPPPEVLPSSETVVISPVPQNQPPHSIFSNHSLLELSDQKTVDRTTGFKDPIPVPPKRKPR